MKIVISILGYCLLSVSGYAQSADANRDISRVKRDTAYIYAEATMKDLDEAMAGARAILEMKISDWIQKLYPGEGVEVCIAKAKEHSFEVHTHRGDYNRAFVYVRKNDIMPVTDKKDVMVFQVNENVEKQSQISPASEGLASEESPIEDINSFLSEEEKTMIGINDFYEIEPYIKELKKDGRLYDYGKYASMPMDASCYIFVYNKQGQVVSVLHSTGSKHFNLKTQKEDKIKNYKNCGAIWFQLK